MPTINPRWEVLRSRFAWGSSSMPARSNGAWAHQFCRRPVPRQPPAAPKLRKKSRYRGAWRAIGLPFSPRFPRRHRMLHTSAPRLTAAVALSLFLPFAAASAQGPEIREFLASNADGLADEDNDTSDWIEIRNSAATPVSLA